jgi:hypothetical protein
MATQAYFSATGETLGTALESATSGVQILLTGCCERALFDQLLRCRRRGVQVELALRNASLNRQSSLAWERLSAAGVVLHWLQSELCIGWPHNLCLIDASTVISGTWQWGPQLSSPSCIVVETETQWLEQCLALFASCTEPASSSSEPLPPGMAAQGAALLISAASGPSTEGSAWELHLWQLHAQAWETELAEIQRQMALFDAQQEQRIGELLRCFLDLKRRYLDHLYVVRGDETTHHAARAANEEYDNYQQSRAAHASDFSENAGSTDPEQQADIKQLYRKLAMLCHPDRVLEAHKEQAQALFQQVRQSYQRSDLAQLQQLQTVLQTQNKFEPMADTPAKQPFSAQRSNALLMSLQNAIAQQQQERNTLMQSATWRTLSSQPNWPVWFNQQADQLQSEIQRYGDALGEHQPEATNGANRPSFSDQCA